MAKRGSAGAAASGGDGSGLLSARLLAVLTREMDALEAIAKELKPSMAPVGEVVEDGRAAGVVSAGAKGRIEAIGQMTRTLEKLLELKRLEVLAAQGDEDEDGEAARLRDELLKRLRALDSRRKSGPTLFGADGVLGAVVGQGDGRATDNGDDADNGGGCGDDSGSGAAGA